MSSRSSDAILLSEISRYSSDDSIKELIKIILAEIDEIQCKQKPKHNTPESLSIRKSVSLSMSTTDPTTETEITIIDQQSNISSTTTYNDITNKHIMVPSEKTNQLNNLEYFTEIGEKMELFDKCHTIDGYYGDGTSYGNIQINNKKCIKYTWTFKLFTMHQSIIGIGIDSSNKKYTNAAFYDCNNQNPYYAVELLTMGAYSTKYCMESKQEAYAEGIDDEDEIKMVLDVAHKSLRFYINGIDQGIAYDNVQFNDDITYFMAVYTWRIAKIELTNFSQIATQSIKY